MPLLPTVAWPLGLAFVAAVAGPVESAPRIELVVRDVEGVDDGLFADALRTRLPDRRQTPAGDPAARKDIPMWGYVQIRPSAGGWTLALILADGRGYYRTVARPEGGHSPRLLANTLSNLIASVEEDALPPDEEDVSIPDEVGQVEGPTPEPTSAAPPEPTPPPNEPPPRYEVGPYLGGLALVALGPPSPRGFAGGGGELGVDIRLREGATFGVAVRSVGHRASGFGLGRFRVGAHAGYSWRVGTFEWINVVGVSAEPWFVRAGGGSEQLRTAGGGAQAAAAALGGFVRCAPGYRKAVNDRVSVRVSPAVQVGGSAVIASGGGVARVQSEDPMGPQSLFRVGGLELSAGLEVGVWFGARPR